MFRKLIKFFLPRPILDALRSKLDTDEVDLLYHMMDGEKKAGVMVDVGAHHGYSLLRFGYAGWEVYAFEPDETNRSILEKNCKGMENVHIDERALSDAIRDNVPIYASEVSSGITSLSAFHESHELKAHISTTTLDEYCREAGITHVDFLKIDTEGHDLKVLKGIPWENLQPGVILCEYENAKTEVLGYRTEDMVKYLEERQYFVILSEWYPIQRYGGTHRWQSFRFEPARSENDAGWGNIIAIRQQDLFEKACRICRQVEPRWRRASALRKII